MQIHFLLFFPHSRLGDVSGVGGKRNGFSGGRVSAHVGRFVDAAVAGCR